MFLSCRAHKSLSVTKFCGRLFVSTALQPFTLFIPWPLTTLVLVKFMEVYFPFFLPVRHVMEEFIVIQSTIFVLVVVIKDVLLK